MKWTIFLSTSMRVMQHKLYFPLQPLPHLHLLILLQPLLHLHLLILLQPLLHLHLLLQPLLHLHLLLQLLLQLHLLLQLLLQLLPLSGYLQFPFKRVTGIYCRYNQWSCYKHAISRMRLQVLFLRSGVRLFKRIPTIVQWSFDTRVIIKSMLDSPHWEKSSCIHQNQ